MADEPMLFVGNLPQCNSDEVRRWLEDADVRVVHVEMKTGFAFVRVADNGSKDRALDVLDKSQFNGRQVSVQVARGDGHIKSREAERKKNAVQTETVFIVNYEPSQTTEADIRNWCAPFGEIKNFLMTGKYCFVQFSSTQEAVDCQQALNDTTPGNGKQITVEFSSKDWSRPPRREGGGGGRGGGRGRRDDRDDRGRGGYGGRRDDRRGGDRRDRRSPSPHYRRDRRSPSPRRGDDYDRRGRSPSPRRGDYDRRGRSPSPPSYRAGRDRTDPYGGGGRGGDRRDSFNGGGRDYGRYDDRRDDHRGGGGGGGAPRDDRIMDRRDDDRDFR